MCGSPARAKRIQNRAVVNESPTERLLKELKAENAKLLLRLTRRGHEGRQADDETSGPLFLLAYRQMLSPKAVYLAVSLFLV